MWSVSFYDDPAASSWPMMMNGSVVPGSSRRVLLKSLVVHAECSFDSLFASNEDVLLASNEGERSARVALADFFVRKISNQAIADTLTYNNGDGYCFVLEPLNRATNNNVTNRRFRRNNNNNSGSIYPPYMLERTDAWSTENNLNLVLRILVYTAGDRNNDATNEDDTSSFDEKKMQSIMETEGEGDISAVSLKNATETILNSFSASLDVNEIMDHVACAVLQNKIRDQLKSMNAIAFIADGSILPRKSGANNAPMASPPAIPFKAPDDSPMKRTIHIDLGKKLISYLPKNNCSYTTATETVVSLTGLVVPTGITLIVGGGYHGKSTLLRTIAAGVYNKIPGDGREYCVTIPDAVTVRAEDGRYVNNCNVSAFISNLPQLPSSSSSSSSGGANKNKVLDTKHFSSHEASGSTSQSANVSEAIEMGAAAFLVDEDVSAANFMARDGRMRALVMDESITPLLYRVNGIYKSLGISSVVVVGGVGDWLDVPDQVILLNKYIASDATAKAGSISKQFSHGHVQYAGRGVVHRLEWQKSGAPIPRRPSDASCERYNAKTTAISLLEGSYSIALHHDDCDNDDDDQSDQIKDVIMKDKDNMIIDGDEDDGYIDLARCEQLLGKKPQLYGCGLGVLWLLDTAKKNPSMGLKELLCKMDETIDSNGLGSLFIDAIKNGTTTNINKLLSSNNNNNNNWIHLISTIGYACRPRKFEVGQSLTRMRGIIMDELPIIDDGEEERIRLEAEKRKQELAALWNARRKKNSQ